MSLPYRYELTLRVTVAGDGMHADGDGAMATAFRLRDLVRTNENVVEISQLPTDVRYLGKVEDHEPTDYARDGVTPPEFNPLGGAARVAAPVPPAPAPTQPARCTREVRASRAGARTPRRRRAVAG